VQPREARHEGRSIEEELIFCSVIDLDWRILEVSRGGVEWRNQSALLEWRIDWPWSSWRKGHEASIESL
jgi:hypothetical protein